MLMFRIAGLIGFLICLPYLIFSQETATAYQIDKDYLLVSVGANAQKTINHHLKDNQTLYSLSRFYGVSLEDLYYHNPNLQSKALTVNQSISIPVANRAIIRKFDQSLDRSQHVPLYYVVRQGETVYTISRTYFRMAPELFLRNNDMQSSDLAIGDSLFVGWLPIAGFSENQNKRNSVRALYSKENEPLRLKFDSDSERATIQIEDGIAFWQTTGTAKGKTNYFALHREAKPGSIIKITNPMSGRILFAKVTGGIPESSYDPAIKIVVTPSLAKALGALDRKFHVKIAYLK